MNKIYVLSSIMILLFLSGCATMTGFEEGRTLGENNSEVGGSVNLTVAPDLFGDDADIDDISSFPNLELGYKYGVLDDLDVGIRVNSNLNLGVYTKYQLLGGKNSNYALSTGFEFSSFTWITYAVQIPVYTSIYPAEDLAININPRLVYQFSAGGGLNGGVTYLGGNVGFLYGKKHKFGVDLGYYSLGVDGSRTGLFNIGVGGKFRFGDLDELGSSFDL